MSPKEIKVKLITIKGLTPKDEDLEFLSNGDYSSRLDKLKDSGAPLAYLDPRVDRTQVFIIGEENEGTS